MIITLLTLTTVLSLACIAIGGTLIGAGYSIGIALVAVGTIWNGALYSGVLRRVSSL